MFARELADAQHADDIGGGVTVVTRSGACCRRIFIVGALTERRGGRGEVMHARIADPTGAFEILTRRQFPDAAATLRYIEPPAFVAVTGHVRLSARHSRTRISVLAEALQVSNRTARDLWVLRTADLTLGRLERIRAALQGGSRDPGIEAAIRHYNPTDADIRELAGMVKAALATVPGRVSAGEIRPLAAREILLEILREHGGVRGISTDRAVALGVQAGLTPGAASQAVHELLSAGECYAPSAGSIRLI